MKLAAFSLPHGEFSPASPIGRWQSWNVGQIAGAAFVLTLALALGSIAFGRASALPAMIWMPNAFGIAALLSVRIGGARQAILAAMVAGIALANFIFGDPVGQSVIFGIANGAEVWLGALLFGRLLRGSPFDSDGTYLRLLGGVILPAALVAGVIGGLTVHLFLETPVLIAIVSWTVADMTSLMVFLPFALIAFAPTRTSFPVTLRGAGMGLIVVALGTAIVGFADAAVHLLAGYFILVPLAALAASQIGRFGTAVMTLGCLLLMDLRGVNDIGAVLDIGVPAFDMQPWTYLIVFLCVAVPANLVAILTDGLRRSEANVRGEDRIKSHFISALSRETLGPVAAIQGTLQELNLADLSHAQQGSVAVGLGACNTLQRQAQQALTLARIDCDALDLSCRPVATRWVMKEWVALLQAEIDHSGKPLRYRVAMANLAPPDVLADSDALMQILRGLASNAVRFSASGLITLSVTLGDKCVHLGIEDEGAGVDPEDAGDIFQPFWQQDAPDGKVSGGGLGLAIGRELAERMGGSLQLCDAKQGGACFVLTLPVTVAVK